MSNSNVDYVTLHYRAVLNDFSNQFINEEFSDCILNAEGKTLKVHKAMLCAQSSFLEKMVLEHQAIGELCLTIDGVLFEDLKSVVQFMYNGSAIVNRKNVGSFLVVAELLGVKWLDHIQILSDNEQSEFIMNISKQCEIVKPDSTETQTPVFKNITNILFPKISKRKKHMKSKKHCKKSRSDRTEKKKCSKIIPAKLIENPKNDKVTGKETHLTEMDENTFCTALGLKKNESQSREISVKPQGIVKTETKIVKNKCVPPLIKINRDAKSNPESYECRDSNLYVSEINTVFIEDKNLSFLNIGANELCIRENNIEIECDVLDASSQFVIDKEATGDIVEIREENIIQAEFLDINPENTCDAKSPARLRVNEDISWKRQGNSETPMTPGRSSKPYGVVTVRSISLKKKIDLILKRRIHSKSTIHILRSKSRPEFDFALKKNLRKVLPRARTENPKLKDASTGEHVKVTVEMKEKDQLQEYLNKRFNLKPFTINLTKYNAEKEKKECDKVKFLSNFNLQRNVGTSEEMFIRNFRRRTCLRSRMSRKLVRSVHYARRNSANFARLRPVTIQLEKLEAQNGRRSLGDRLARRSNRRAVRKNLDFPSVRKRSSDFTLVV